ncbi:MAG: carboxymuconolactone decarboxylase family protein [Phenylobacterium sp.]|uniref:carboxymuconolactone decarboxylase family protein n=1 Tax=Phenylobacterium sp. TaxID=1871053 RepID=UPI0027353062|nr:carboxymuconolactone decarboxylase family protein [Phenylobacterium sp.]MDP3749639.1 carboxymuconolactone decarboxylase family protein [Phenylobacterium sp.]
MPRIAPAAEPFPEAVQRRLAKLTPLNGQHLLLFRTLARDERLFARFMDGGLLDRGHLSLRERELTILRVCALNRSDYEWGVHVAYFAERAGFTQAEVAATAAPFEAHPWTGRDALILRLCDALQDRCELADDLWSETRRIFSEMALLEILMLIGKYRQVCILTNALRLEREADTPRLP